jgi:hypothetical protein
MNLRSSLRTLAFASVCALPLPAGVLTINFTETGGNVVVTASGSLTDFSAWSSFGGATFVASLISPSSGAMAFTGTGSGDGYRATGTPSGNWTLGFGTGTGLPTNATSYSGHTLGFVRDTSIVGLPFLILPNGYGFGTPTPLSSTMTFNSATFLSLGITTGSYVFNNGGDTIQLTFGGGGGSSVPDAGPGPALALLLGGLGLRQWHSSRRARAAA